MKNLPFEKLKPAVSSGERGIALILVLLAMLVLSVLAAAIVFTARAETFAGYNYKLDTQADYLAKAGIQRAVNWFRSTHYRAITESEANNYYQVTSGGSPFNLFTSNASPVICKSNCSSINSPVQLIGFGGGSSNFPDINNSETSPREVTEAFASDLNDPAYTRVTADSNNSGYFNVNAVLLNYETVNVGYQPPLNPTPVETWLITSKATWTGGSGSTTRVATAEEQAIVQPIYIPTWGNALYGFCSVTMQGSSGTCTDAFNSSLGAYGGGNPSVASGQCDSTTSNNVIGAGASVGANGGVTLGTNVTVSGDVVIGTGGSSGCTASGYSGSTSSVLGQVINGPYKAPPPTPTFRANFPSGSPSYSLSSGSVQVLPAGATWSNSPFPQTTGVSPATSSPCMDSSCDGTSAHPYEISSISMSGGGGGGNAPRLELVGGSSPLNPVYYDIDSLSETQGEIDVSGYVIINVKSNFSIGGLGIANGVSSTIPPECVVINYAGTNSVSISGNGAISALLNAPNATVSLGGGGSGGYFVGAVQANNVSVQGGYPVHYDVQLSQDGGTMGVIVTSAYSRKKM
jgi:type II secretory pathway pseudopilin PulG